MAEHTSTLFDSLEQWRAIPGYDGIYEVSNLGRVRSYRKICNVRGLRLDTPKLLGLHPDGNGRIQVCLTTPGGRGKPVSVPRCVMAAFVGPPANKTIQVDHVNGIHDDNRLANLEYVTPSVNAYRAFAMGLKSHRGWKNPAAKLTVEGIRTIRQLAAEGWTQRAIAKHVGVGASTVYRVLRKEVWRDVA